MEIYSTTSEKEESRYNKIIVFYKTLLTKTWYAPNTSLLIETLYGSADHADSLLFL